MWPNTVNDWLQAIFYVVAIAGVIASACQYRRNSMRARTHWLFELYQRFYQHQELKQMRVRIDWGDTGFAKEEKDRDLLRELDDFLNFFEFIAYLQKRGELKEKEVRAMFDYPLRRIAEEQPILEYVRRYGYEELDALLKDLRYAS